MPSIDDYTDEELGRMIRAANQVIPWVERASVTVLDSLCEWLSVAGLGWMSATIKTAAWAYDKIRNIMRTIFG